MSEQSINKDPTKRKGRAVNQYDLNGTLIQRWDRISDASRATGANESSIASCCRDERHTAGGFKWRYCET